MKRFNNAAKYFCAAFQAELKARGRGIQKKLAEATGISRGLLCDLNKGRTRGTAEKHRLLAKALGVKYEDLIDQGLQIERKRLGLQEMPEPDFTGDEVWEEKFRLAQKVIAAQEKIIAEMNENSKLRQEIEELRRASRASEGLSGPSVEAARSAPVMDSE